MKAKRILIIFTCFLICFLGTNCNCKKDKVYDAPSEVIVEDASINVVINETVKVKATISPETAKQEFTYTVSDEKILTVTSDGTIKGITEGLGYLYVYSSVNKEIYKVIEVKVVHPLLESDTYDAYNIVTGPYEDASTGAIVNYHTHNTKTSVEYTLATDTEFKNAKKVTGEGYYFTDRHEKVTVSFKPRNVYHVEITNLEKNTSYIYRINKGNNVYSEVYSFTTAKGDDSDTSFMAVADTHYYISNGQSSGSEICDTMIDNAINLNPNISFILEAGDIVDKGGNADIWDMMFSIRTAYNKLPVIGAPGNHEYYIKDTGMGDASYFAAHSAANYNGPTGKVGSSSYFVHNNTLFIMIDNVVGNYSIEQRAWLEHVLQNVEAKFVVCTMHIPIFYEDGERDEAMMGVFEKYSVDVVLNGHYHSDAWVNDYYQGITTTKNQGVNYVGLAGSGAKGNGTDLISAIRGYVFDISGETIRIRKIDGNANVLYDRTLTTKKHKDFDEVDHETLKNSVKLVLNKETKTLDVNWSEGFYGNVKKVVLTDNLRNKLNKEVFIMTTGYTNIHFDSIKDGYDYDVTLSIYYANGLKEDLNYTFKNSHNAMLAATQITSNSCVLTFEPAGDDFLWDIKEYVVYNGTEVLGKYEYTSGMNAISSITLNGLNKSTKYNLTVVALDYKGQIVYKNSILFTTK